MAQSCSRFVVLATWEAAAGGSLEHQVKTSLDNIPRPSQKKVCVWGGNIDTSCVPGEKKPVNLKWVQQRGLEEFEVGGRHY